LPQESMDLAGVDGHADPRQCLGPSECLRHSFDFQYSGHALLRDVCGLDCAPGYWTCQSFFNWSSTSVGWFQDVPQPTAALTLSCVRICVGWTEDCFTSIGIPSESRSIASIIT